MIVKYDFSWSKCEYSVPTDSLSVFPGLVRPQALRQQAGPSHIDAGGHSLVLSLPPAPAPLLPPHPPWL